MKKIAFITSLDSYGGTEIALIRLLNAIDSNKYDITVYCLKHINGLINQLPSWVKIESINYKSNKEIIIGDIKNWRIDKALKTIFVITLRKMDHIIHRNASFSRMVKMLYQYDDIIDVYDIAIAWHLPGSIHNLLTLFKIKASKKFMWVHMDISKDTRPIDAEYYFHKFDRICCVSKACADSFYNMYPSCKNKLATVYNVVDKKKITQLASVDTFIKNKDDFILITCGRLSKEKNPFYAIPIMKNLLNFGYSYVKWFFIGDGSIAEEFKNAIDRNGLNEHILLLGFQNNPFSFVKGADIYIQMSTHESYCMALEEAQLLGIPAISTNFSSAYEIIDDGITGFICENNYEDIYHKIKLCLDDRVVIEQFRKRLEQRDSRWDATKQFTSIIDTFDLNDI